jgi:hypothetical protein
MNTISRLVLLTILFMGMSVSTQSNDKISHIFLPGEELRYSVKWKFIRLGSITIKRLDDGEDAGTFRVSMLVESNPSLPFVDIREYNESLIDASSIKTIDYIGDFRNKKSRTETRYIYNKQNGTLYHHELDKNSGEYLISDTVYDVSEFVNGPSLFSYTRRYSCSNDILDIPTLVKGAIKSTRIDFSPGVEEISISNWPFPLRTRRFEGFADWEGGTSQGLSGKFTGWISDDFAAVVVRAEMKVFLGSIKIELESWNREDWTPSTAQRLAENK